MQDTNKQSTIPDGYMKDARGHLIPIELVKPIDLQRDELVRELIGDAKELTEKLRAFKQRALADAAAFVSMSAEEYQVKLGGNKGNVTLPTFDGQFKIQVAKAENINFDERLQAAKALVDECINDWSTGARPEIQALVQQAFETDQEGTLNTGRVLALRRLDIKDEKWQRAMTAIGESVQVVGTKTYVRFYERIGDSDEYKDISLNIARL